MKDFPPIRFEGAADTSFPAVLRVGVSTGALLVIVMLGALVAANRIPRLERYALERGAISYSLFMLFIWIPVARFRNSPLKMFASALIGRTLSAVAYDVAGVRHTSLMALCEGAPWSMGSPPSYSGVRGMVLNARHHPIRPGRKAASETARHSR